MSTVFLQFLAVFCVFWCVLACFGAFWCVLVCFGVLLLFHPEHPLLIVLNLLLLILIPVFSISQIENHGTVINIQNQDKSVYLSKQKSIYLHMKTIFEINSQKNDSRNEQKLVKPTSPWLAGLALAGWLGRLVGLVRSVGRWVGGWVGWLFG